MRTLNILGVAGNIREGINKQDGVLFLGIANRYNRRRHSQY
jgi:hypothetical protein